MSSLQKRRAGFAFALQLEHPEVFALETESAADGARILREREAAAAEAAADAERKRLADAAQLSLF